MSEPLNGNLELTAAVHRVLARAIYRPEGIVHAQLASMGDHEARADWAHRLDALLITAARDVVAELPSLIGEKTDGPKKK